MPGVSDWGWASLGAMIRERRAELGMSKYAVQRLGGPSAKLLTELERGEPQHTPRPATYSGVDRALYWVPGTAHEGYSGQQRRLTYALAVAHSIVRQAENGSGTAQSS